MDQKETVRTLMDAVQTGNFRLAQSLLSDDFRFSGPVPEPLSGSQWIGMGESLKAACPDLDYHFAVDHTERSVVGITTRMTGTQTEFLDLTVMGLGTSPATGNAFSMGLEYGDVTVRDEKVVAWALRPTSGAGLLHILAQLGITSRTEAGPEALSHPSSHLQLPD